MSAEERTTKAFPFGPVHDGAPASEDTCAVCETRPATGVAGLCTWCGQEVAAAVGEMQA